MTALFRVVLVAAFTVACIPTVAVGQNVSTDSLLSRIDSLQRRTSALERRVSELEMLIKTSPSRPSPGSSTLANWRRLRNRMTLDEVRTLLGEPDRVLAPSANMTIWYYPDNGHVSFDSGRLDGWLEPSR
jgi:hypothetical protein